MRSEALKVPIREEIQLKAEGGLSNFGLTTFQKPAD